MCLSRIPLLALLAAPTDDGRWIDADSAHTRAVARTSRLFLPRARSAGRAPPHGASRAQAGLAAVAGCRPIDTQMRVKVDALRFLLDNEAQPGSQRPGAR